MILSHLSLMVSCQDGHGRKHNGWFHENHPVAGHILHDLHLACHLSNAVLIQNLQDISGLHALFQVVLGENSLA